MAKKIKLTQEQGSLLLDVLINYMESFDEEKDYELLKDLNEVHLVLVDLYGEE